MHHKYHLGKANQWGALGGSAGLCVSLAATCTSGTRTCCLRLEPELFDDTRRESSAGRAPGTAFCRSTGTGPPLEASLPSLCLPAGGGALARRREKRRVEMVVSMATWQAGAPHGTSRAAGSPRRSRRRRAGAGPASHPFPAAGPATTHTFLLRKWRKV